MQASLIYNRISEYIAYTGDNNSLTHDARDLKKVSSRIRSLAAGQPVYSIATDRSTLSYPINLKVKASALQKSIYNISGAELDKAFENNTVAVKNAFDELHPENVDAQIINKDEWINNGETSFTVNDVIFPQKQLNIGRNVNLGSNILPGGTYSFHIATNDETYAFKFPVAKETNDLNTAAKLTSVINSADIGITAKLLRSEGSAEQFHIALSSDQSFDIYDMSYPDSTTFGLVQYFSADNKTSEATSGQIVIDDVNYPLRDDHFEYNGVSLTLRDSEGYPVTVFPAATDDIIKGKLNTLINSFNSLLAFTENNEKTISGDSTSTRPKLSSHIRVVRELESMMASFRSECEAIGLFTDQDGYLAFDEEKLSASVQDGTAKDFFYNNKGFINALGRKAATMSIDPISYAVKKPVIYPNFTSKETFEPYITSRYSGLYFNDYC